MQAIMVHRIACMARNNKVLVTCLMIGFASSVIVAFVLAGLAMKVLNTPFFWTPTTRACIPLRLEPSSVGMWFNMLAFETVILGLAIAEGIQYMRETRIMHGMSDVTTRKREWTKEGSLVHIMLRDSIIFPLIGLTLTLANIIASYAFYGLAVGYTITTVAAASPILGCRLILHLRDAYYQPFSDEVEGNTMRMPTMSSESSRSREMPDFVLSAMSRTTTVQLGHTDDLSDPPAPAEMK